MGKVIRHNKLDKYKWNGIQLALLVNIPDCVLSVKNLDLLKRLKRVVKCRHWAYAELMERWQRSPFDNPIKTKRY